MFARTDRLLLRPAFPEDAGALARVMADKGIAMHSSRVPWPFGEDEAARWIVQPADPTLPRCLILLRTGAAPVLVGGIALERRVGGVVDLGYWIARPYRERGIATEAARAVVDIARALRLPRLEAGHLLDNPASGRVLEKLGFRPTGDLRAQSSCAREGRRPARVYELALEAEASDPATAIRAA